MLPWVKRSTMKTRHLLLLSVAAFGPALAASAAETPVVGRAEVVFFEPEKFTDVRDSYMGDSARTTYLDQIRDHVLEQAKNYVPAGTSSR